MIVVTTASPDRPFDSLGFIMAYEDGILGLPEVVKGFQALIDNGMAWRLQGSYGRMAERLIRSDHCVDTHNILTARE